MPGVIESVGRDAKDVSNKQELWGGYTKGERYVLLHDVFLQEEEFPTKLRKYAGPYVAVAPDELVRDNFIRLYSVPDSMREYFNEREQWPEVIGIIEAGTQIECTKLVGYGSLTVPMTHYIFGTILDGPFRSTFVDIHDISYWRSKSKDDPIVPYPNYNLIQRVP